jgi:hypothetical protein
MKGVWFDDKHSYSDFGLVLNSKEISLPEPKTYIIDVPCADGSLDLSTALTGGDIKYQNRSIVMNFTALRPWNQLESLRSDLANHLHGKTMKVIFDADCNFYYTGRLRISDFDTKTFPATVTIEMDAEPYKLNIKRTVIYEPMYGTKTVIVPEQKMKVVPNIKSEYDISMTYKGKTYQLYTGSNIFPDVVLSSSIEDNTFEFTGGGNVFIEFRGGEL